MAIRRLVLGLVLALAASAGNAGELVGRVVSVHDGDTLTLLVDRRQVKIRLAEIDAPELGRVTCAGVDANAEQVRRGMAWVFVRYAPKGSPPYGVQADARRERRGLWVDPQPVAPWEWRSARRSRGRTAL